MNNPVAERMITTDANDPEFDAQAQGLMGFLREYVGALLSLKIGPLPACNRCGGVNVRAASGHMQRLRNKSGLPQSPLAVGVLNHVGN